MASNELSAGPIYFYQVSCGDIIAGSSLNINPVLN